MGVLCVVCGVVCVELLIIHNLYNSYQTIISSTNKNSNNSSAYQYIKSDIFLVWQIWIFLRHMKTCFHGMRMRRQYEFHLNVCFDVAFNISSSMLMFMPD